MKKLKALVLQVKTKIILFPRVYDGFITKMFLKECERLKNGRKPRMFVRSLELLHFLKPQEYKYKTSQDFLFFNSSIGLRGGHSSDNYIYFTKRYFVIGYLRCLLYNIGVRIRRHLKHMGFIDTREGMIIKWSDWRWDFWNSRYFRLYWSYKVEKFNEWRREFLKKIKRNGKGDQ